MLVTSFFLNGNQLHTKKADDQDTQSKHLKNSKTIAHRIKKNYSEDYEKFYR